MASNMWFTASFDTQQSVFFSKILIFGKLPNFLPIVKASSCAVLKHPFNPASCLFKQFQWVLLQNKFQTAQDTLGFLLSSSNNLPALSPTTPSRGPLFQHIPQSALHSPWPLPTESFSWGFTCSSFKIKFKRWLYEAFPDSWGGQV